MATPTVAPGFCGFATSTGTARGAGEPARERLLLAGLNLFAQHGYAKTSIRQIALAAEANVASVSYYFGNKAGLYRAIFFGLDAHPPHSGESGAEPADRPVATLADMFEHILAPLRSGAQARSWIKLHRREMLEPTGLWQEKVDRGMQPMHDAVVALLCHKLGVAAPDDEVEALAQLVMAPAIHLLVNCEVIDVLAPQLLAGPDAVDAWRQRLLRSAGVLIAAERRRRGRAARTAKPARPLRRAGRAAQAPQRHLRREA